MIIDTNEDTIVAISTPLGRGAIGIIRISGKKTLEISQSIFSRADKLLTYPFRLLRGDILDSSSNELIDDGLMVYFPNPRSFTGEDLVEIHCHGAPVVLQRILQQITSLGARIANPGEFTMRAFFNGRINLTQAEGIRDLIDAQTIYQAQLAARQTKGALSTRLQPAKEILLTLIVHLESAVEFVEESLDTQSREQIFEKLSALEIDLSCLLETYKTGKIIRQGLNLAIIGRPNVGKSSLFNALVAADRAIVTEIPGTTRDTLSEFVSIEGIPIRLVDTAGIRDSVDTVEKIGIERSYAALSEADLVLLVLDAAENIQEDDQKIFQALQNRKCIVVLNKIDLLTNLTTSKPEKLDFTSIQVSALNGEGLDLLRKAILQECTESSIAENSDFLITEARHAEQLRLTIEALAGAKKSLHEGYSEEVPLADLHCALQALGEITGETTMEGIYDRIFSTFCIGK